MNDDLIEIGKIVKQRRQERNLSLKEIENATSIRMNFLAAIEEGQLSKLISPVYAQGFIKKYAAFLELDGEALMREHPEVMKMLSEGIIDKQEFSFGLGSVEVRGTPAGEVKWLPNLMWVGLSVIFILCFWFLARYLDVI
jgi:cytoskeletal protein RodZ